MTWRFAPFALLLGCSAINSPAASIPDRGFVPDEQTAIRIAEAVWIPIYGEKMIASERPFTATLKDDVWSVTGSVTGLSDCPRGKVCVGGTAFAKIARRDGTILQVAHYQ
jgi:hypothetical protein